VLSNCLGVAGRQCDLGKKNGDEIESVDPGAVSQLYILEVRHILMATT
jgi:hypothetical protein